MKKSTLHILSLLISICIFSCKEDYEEIHLDKVNTDGNLFYDESFGIRLMLPKNYDILTRKKFKECLDKLDLDSTSYNYQKMSYLNKSESLIMHYDTSNIFNYIGIIKPDKYLSLIPSNISNFKIGHKKSMEKAKEFFPELIYQEFSKSKILIDEPYKYYKTKNFVQLNDWKRFNTIYLKANTNIRETVILIFANQDESFNFDEYITSVKFLIEEK